MILRDLFIGNYGISQKFGENFIYKGKWAYGKGGHPGIDFRTPTGVVCVSPTNGVVLRAGYDKIYGNYIQVWDKEQNIAWKIGHLKTIEVSVGQRVWVGKRIALTNNTGFSTGSHIHFELVQVDTNGMRLNRSNGHNGFINPLSYFRAVNLQSPVKEDPIVVAQREAERKAREAAERIKNEELKRQRELEAKLAIEKAKMEAELKAEEERKKAEKKKATVFPDDTTPLTEPPVHADNKLSEGLVGFAKVLVILIQVIQDILNRKG